MKFLFGYPFFTAPANPEFLSGKAIAELAQAAEQAGFFGAFFSEHPAPPQKWRLSGGHDALDPFVALSWAAAATQNLKLLTNLAVLPYRNPFLLAKSAASLDVLSGGRLILGVGTGYLKPEFSALGVDFEKRNQLFDEVIEIIKLAWAGEPVNYKSENFSAEEIVCLPRPLQEPHPPIWLGGNAKLTRRRVAEWGQGWMPMPNPRALAGRRRSAPLETNEELAEMIAYMKEQAESSGRSQPIDIFYMILEGGNPGSDGFELDKYLAAVQDLQKMGVTHLAVVGSGKTQAEVLQQIEFIGSQIIPAS